MWTLKLTMILGLVAATLAACSGPQEQPIELRPAPTREAPERGPVMGADRSDEEARGQPIEVASDGGSLPIDLSADVLQQVYAVAAEDLSYRWRFGPDRSPPSTPITFDGNGHARLPLSGLTTGVPYDFVLQILQAGQPVLEGVIAQLRLEAGQTVRRQLTLRPLNGTNIDIIIGGGGGDNEIGDAPQDPIQPSPQPRPRPQPQPGSGAGTAAFAQVQPIFQAHCVSCHSGAGGFWTEGMRVDLTAYPFPGVPPAKLPEIVRQLREMTQQGTMPPPGIRDGLTETQKAAIANWADVVLGG